MKLIYYIMWYCLITALKKWNCRHLFLISNIYIDKSIYLNREMNPIVDEIIFKCSRSVLEDPSSLFGDIIYRNFDLNICDNNSFVLKTSFLPRKIIINSRKIPSSSRESLGTPYPLVPLSTPCSSLSWLQFIKRYVIAAKFFLVDFT